MGGLRIEGNTSGRVAGVDGGGSLQVAFSNDPTYIGGVRVFSEVDAGTLTGTPTLISPHTTPEFRLKVGLDTLLFTDNFNGTAQNTSNWLYYFATMTITQAGGFALFNTNTDTTNAHACSLQSFRTFVLPGQSTLTLEFNMNMTNTCKANQIFEMGLFRPASTPTTAPVDGLFWRVDYSGAAPRLQGVAVFNGGAETVVNLTTALPIQNTTATYLMCFDANEINWWVDDILAGTILITGLNSAPFLGTGMPIGMQQRNIGSVGASPMQVKVANVLVTLDEMNSSKPWPHQMAGFNLMSTQNQNGTVIPTSTAMMATSLSPTVAAIANATAAAGNLGLGGQFAVNPTLTAGTDGILCSFANPAGSINQTPRTLYITGITIQSIVTVALVGGPIIYAHALCYGGSNVSLATTESTTFATGTAKAYRRVPLGLEGFPATAAVGVVSGVGVRVRFQTPIVINPLEFVAITTKNLGTVSSAGVITSVVTVNGYWE
jgi:hypothetical protein